MVPWIWLLEIREGFGICRVQLAAVLPPAVNTLSRYREHEADRYGLELIQRIVHNGGKAAATAQAFQRDAEIDLSNPARRDGSPGGCPITRL